MSRLILQPHARFTTAVPGGGRGKCDGRGFGRAQRRCALVPAHAAPRHAAATTTIAPFATSFSPTGIASLPAASHTHLSTLYN